MTEYTKGFERWWTKFPAHRRREKVKCFEVWQKRNLEPRTSEIVEKLVADVSFDPAWQPDGQGKQFIPLSKTYLNGGRYDDDKPKPRRAMPTAAARESSSAGLNKWQTLANRVFMKYLRLHRGMPDETLAKCLESKNRVIHDTTAAFDEELQQGGTARDVTKSFVGLLTSNWDADTGKTFGNRIMGAYE